jgi:hypothetical protein
MRQHTPKRARYQQINQTLYTFHNGTKYQKKRFVFQKINTSYESRNFIKNIFKEARKKNGRSKDFFARKIRQ